MSKVVSSRSFAISLVIAISVILSSCSGFRTGEGALEKVNFSGKWRLNASKSVFGPVPGSTDGTIEIAQRQMNLYIASTEVRTSGKSMAKSTYLGDGGQSFGETIGFPLPIRGICHWDGSALIFEGEGDYSGFAVHVLENWQLSPDHKTITINRQVSNDVRGAATQSIVLEK